jgi:hypothetical protein
LYLQKPTSEYRKSYYSRTTLLSKEKQRNRGSWKRSCLELLYWVFALISSRTVLIQAVSRAFLFICCKACVRCETVLFCPPGTRWWCWWCILVARVRFRVGFILKLYKLSTCVVNPQMHIAISVCVCVLYEHASQFNSLDLLLSIQPNQVFCILPLLRPSNNRTQSPPRASRK